MADKKLNILFYSMDGVGHLNACIGLAQALKSRGHRISFLVNLDAPFKFPLDKCGFEQIGLHDTSTEKGGNEQENKEPMDRMKEFISVLMRSKIFGPGSSKEKLEFFRNMEFVSRMVSLLIALNSQIEDAIRTFKPDVILVDHFLIPPAILTCDIPYFLIYSGNPLPFYESNQLPPIFSGYSVDSDRSNWQEFADLHRTIFLNNINTAQNELNSTFNFKPAPELAEALGKMKSPFFNIYGYPEELDYHEIVPRPKDLLHVDAFFRDSTPQPFQLPEGFVNPGEKLVYFSLGSMGCINLELMEKIIDILGKTSHKYIISKGPRAAEYKPLPTNCWGDAHLPQMNILPMVDLVITHGGNNTVTESFTLGKPMIIMPLMGDQFDNAQRLHDKGFGIRMDPFNFTEQELIDSINKLINDQSLKERLSQISKRIETSNSKETVCIEIEKYISNRK